MTLSVHAWLTGAMVVLLPDNEPSGRDGVWTEDCQIRPWDDKVTELKALSATLIYHLENIPLKGRHRDTDSK